ncbi:MAG: hypothetical protein LBD59_10375 [Prevotellaceae bacterium]|jgi:hypothetical protein|nr:hypothetical protein [Prevotellaceae bacterium]
MKNKVLYSILATSLFVAGLWLVLGKEQNKTKNDFLEESLCLAGANRTELEKVLNCYRQNSADSLKYRAAIFLISNMAGHFSYADNYMEEYYDASDSVSRLFAHRSQEEIQNAFDELALRFSSKPAVVCDLRTVKAGYLIAGIDRAFDDWQNGEWATHLDFDEFCEYLLPYKVADLQTLDNWREYLADPVYGDLQYLSLCMHSANSAYWACDKVNQIYVRQQSRISVDAKNAMPLRRINSLLATLKKKDCEDYSIATVSIMRAKGIPTAIDFTPQWPNRRLGHAWGVVLDNAGMNRPFDETLGFGAPTIIGLPLAKVFRRSWAVNLEMLELGNMETSIPNIFRNVCIKDVTDEYQRTSEVHIPVEQTENAYVYLTVFNNRDWTPIHWGKIGNNGQAVFSKMGRDIVYLPVVMKNGGMRPVATPFILTLLGEVKPIVPNIDKKQTLRLTRKHPPLRFNTFYSHYVLGSKFQAANKPDFSDAVTVHTVNRFGTESDEFFPRLNKKYRYWRHYSAPEGRGFMAELYLFTQGENVTQKGKPIGISGTEKRQKVENLFDKDPATVYEAPNPSDCWAGLDFGEPVEIDRIIYIPKCDENGITPGNDYELCYWNNHRWHSLGRKIADNIVITFDNCPTEALFLLHNHTIGREERIFTYENGKQVWW